MNLFKSVHLLKQIVFKVVNYICLSHTYIESCGTVLILK